MSVADEERRRLAERLRLGPDRRLAAVDQLLAGAARTTTDPSVAGAVEHVRAQLEQSRRALDVITSGLHPGELDGDFAGALEDLADRAPLPITLRLPDADVLAGVPRGVRAALYFSCAEVLTNALKHAAAAHVTMELSIVDGDIRCSIADDGVGGADLAGGSGLRGVADRVAALGGSIHVDSAPGAGTGITITLPRDPPLGDGVSPGHP